jgi:hypothetical protein
VSTWIHSKGTPASFLACSVALLNLSRAPMRERSAETSSWSAAVAASASPSGDVGRGRGVGILGVVLALAEDEVLLLEGVADVPEVAVEEELAPRAALDGRVDQALVGGRTGLAPARLVEDRLGPVAPQIGVLLGGVPRLGDDLQLGRG